MRSIARKLPERLVKERRMADTPRVSRAERLTRVSKSVREESMKVNSEFAAIESDLDEARG